jgi:hypothetical protein
MDSIRTLGFSGPTPRRIFPSTRSPVRANFWACAGNRAFRSNPQAPFGALRYFRFNPLRGQKSPSLAIFGLGVCLWQTPSSPPPAESNGTSGIHAAALTGAFRAETYSFFTAPGLYFSYAAISRPSGFSSPFGRVFRPYLM